MEPSAQSPFQKLNFGSSSQKTCKSRYQTFLVLSNFTGFLYFVLNVLPWVEGFVTSSLTVTTQGASACSPRDFLFILHWLMYHVNYFGVNLSYAYQSRWKLTKLGEIGFTMECFTADFWQFSSTTVKSYLLSGRIGTNRQFQACQRFSFQVFSWSVSRQATHTFTF